VLICYRVGGNGRSLSQMNEFHKVLAECELSDLGYRGTKFIWCNYREGSEFIKEHLDRCVANSGWREFFPRAEVLVNVSTWSDHATMILKLSPENWGGRKRRFLHEAHWMMDDGYQDVVKESWTRDTCVDGGWAGIEKKLASCRRGLLTWRVKKIDVNAGQIALLHNRLLNAQGVDEENNGNEVVSLRRGLQELMEKSDIYWRQRVKTDWLKNRDRNTRYYHACASTRRKKNFISRILNERGQTCTAEEDINIAFTEYFSGLFTASPEGDLARCLQNVASRIDGEMNASLLKLFLEEKVQCALFQMAPTKTLGSDGYPAGFFQKNWGTLGGDICRTILGILNSGSMPNSLNTTHIALIPKIKNPSSVKDFRPISICNVLYKIISKVLANRLKKFLNHIISPVQSAFIPGRLITDNVVVAYETLHTMHTRLKGKKGFMTVKVDMSKAYDRVEWNFWRGLWKKWALLGDGLILL
jgi:hypothetical protein